MRTPGLELFLVLLGGCACGPVEAPPPKELAPTFLEGTTNVTADRQLGIRFWNRTPTEEVTSKVAEGTHLETWPEADQIPTSTSMDAGLVLVEPSAPLSSRWYALRLDAFPAGYGLPVGWRPLFTKATDGSLTSLFHFGPAPQLIAVELYAEKSSFALNFSEPLAFMGDVSIDVDGSHFSCAIQTPRGSSEHRWSGTCGTSIGANSAMTLTITQGSFANVAGLPYVVSVRPSELPWCSSGCGLVAVFANRGPL